MICVEKLTDIQEKNKSMICLGLDLDPKRMPVEFTKSNKSMYEYAMMMIEATKEYVCAYKPNMAFFESRGPDGLSLLRSITSRIPDDIPIIVDGKRGDIGNTASHYAEALYDIYRADWVTLNPYMGYDTIRPFLEHKGKGVFILCLTSNSGSKDFQHLDVNGKPLYKVVAEKVDYWNKENNCGLVVGATQPEELKEVRAISGSMPLLIPGVGAQGGSLEKAVIYGTDNFTKPAVINVSRSVLYASIGADFTEKAVEELKRLNRIVAKIRSGEITLESLALQEAENPPVVVEAKPSVVVHEMPKPKIDPPVPPKQEAPSEPTAPAEPAIPASSQPEERVEQPQQPSQESQMKQPEQAGPTPQPPVERPRIEVPPIPQPVNERPSEEKKPEPASQVEGPKAEQAQPEKTAEKAEEAPKPMMPKPPPLPKPPPVLPPRPDLMNKRREERRNNDENRHNRENRHDDRNQQNRPQNNYNRDQNRNNNDQNRGNHNFSNNRDNRSFNQNENNRNPRNGNN